jgi:hypothetical protein
MFNSMGPIPANSVFKIFDAPAYSGTFATIQPEKPSSTQTWDLSQLPVDGTIKVIGEPTINPNPPTLAPVTYSNGNLNFTGTGGNAGSTFDVLASSDITAPLSAWTVAETRQFDATGAFSFIMPVDRNTPSRFFVLRAR